MPLSPNLRAALFMTVSMAGFTVNDGITKHMSEVMNMGQVMFLRGAFATLFVAVLAWHQGALSNLRLALQPLVLVRWGITIYTTSCTLYILYRIVQQSSPVPWQVPVVPW